MKISFAEHLNAVSPFASSYLNDTFLSRLEKISNLFPDCSSNYIFEIQLGSPDPAIDFSLCILKSEVIDLLKYWRGEKLQTIIQQDYGWKRLFQFCTEWGKAGSLLNRNISDVWFEFDNNQLEKDVPGASFFFSPNKLHKRTCRDLAGGNIDWLFGGMCILFKDCLSVAIERNIKKCLNALPENGGVFQIGVMMPRNFNGVRLCTVMPVEYYSPYLVKIGWQGSREYLGQILQMLKGYVDAVFIDIDVDEGIHVKIGIECGYRGGVDNGKKLRLNKFLNYLMDQRLCIREKAGSILKWSDNPDEQPDFYSRENYVIRTLSHIKIILNPGNSLDAKAYLSFSSSFK